MTINNIRHFRVRQYQLASCRLAFCVLSVLVLSARFCAAQSYQVAADEVSKDVTMQRTEIGRFLNTNGLLVTQDRKVIKSYDGMGFSKLTITAVCAWSPDAPDKKIKGFELEFYDRRQENGNFREQYHLAYIDLAEGLNLQKALAYMVQKASEWKGKKDIGTKRIHFHGTDDYEVYFDQGVEDDHLKQQFTAYGGSSDSPRVTFRRMEDLDKLGQSITEATEWLSKEQ